VLWSSLLTLLELGLRLMPWKYSALANLDDYKVTTTSVSNTSPDRFRAQWEYKFRLVVCTGPAGQVIVYQLSFA
jgi:hypothetical protein